MPEQLTNAIALTDETMQLLAESNLNPPFVILNIDHYNEPHNPKAHRISCDYARDRERPDRMRPDSKRENRTGSHWLMLVNDLPADATRNCKCWQGR